MIRGSVRPAIRASVRSSIARDEGGEPWTPASLFAASKVGAWYDPSDLTTLWQDSGRTTPVTADGDPVGCIDDKSGNGAHWVQASSTLRPVYRTAGGLHWLETDGVDDLMSTGAVFATLGMPVTLTSAALPALVGVANSDTFALLWLGTGTGVSGSDNAHVVLGGRADSQRRPRVASRGVGLTPSVPVLTTTGDLGTYPEPVIASGVFTSGSQVVRSQGVQRASSATVWNAQTVANASLVMGGGQGTAPGGIRTPLAQKYYGVVVIFDELSSGGLAKTEVWLAAKAGVSI
jgi:hypothetical protein